jgi:lysozyme family protein
MPLKFEDLRSGYTQLWESISERPNWASQIAQVARGLIKDRDQYRTVETLTGVPWFVVGIIHQMESGRNFSTHLHNGDPLSARTVNVPAGRPTSGSPPFAWTESAADALRLMKMDQVTQWSCERIAFELEKYNGFRSRTEHNINTPYLWSGSTHYTKGKFVRDNVWDPEFVSKQVGCMPILRNLAVLDQSIGEALRTRAAPALRPASEEQTPLDLKELQRRLSQITLYRDEIDGRYGPNTRRAIQALLVTEQVSDWTTWTAERLIVAGQQALCRLNGIDAGVIDGYDGPQTQYALSVYEGRQRNDPSVETWRDANEDKPPLTPPPQRATTWPRQKDVRAFFGQVGQHQTRLEFPYPMRIAWGAKSLVKSTVCHEKVHDATKRVLTRVLDHYGPDKIRELHLDLFGGCLNVRKMRGGSAWSMHSWGIAFDFDPERNQLKWSQSKAGFAAPAYRKWFELWEEEGAISLGRARDYDWMHLQFARL